MNNDKSKPFWWFVQSQQKYNIGVDPSKHDEETKQKRAKKGQK